MLKARGFSLIEVLVAVAIVSLALPALLLNTIQQLDGTAYLRDKIIASWVAGNVLTEIIIQHRTQGELPDNNSSGTEEMAGRSWRWEVSMRHDNKLVELYLVKVRVWRGNDRSAIASNHSYLYDARVLELSQSTGEQGDP